jgi:hypothetical protein
MTLAIMAAMAGARILERVERTGLVLEGELADRARKAAESAATLQLEALTGKNIVRDQEILAARLQALKAAGASNVANAIVEGTRELLLSGLQLL